MRRIGPLTAQDRAELVRFRNFLRHIAREKQVSLKIEARYDPGTRAELRQRIKSLLHTHAEVVIASEGSLEERAAVTQKLSEEVKALYMALTDCGPTHDEMVEMIVG